MMVLRSDHLVSLWMRCRVRFKLAMRRRLHRVAVVRRRHGATSCARWLPRLHVRGVHGGEVRRRGLRHHVHRGREVHLVHLLPLGGRRRILIIMGRRKRGTLGGHLRVVMWHRRRMAVRRSLELGLFELLFLHKSEVGCLLRRFFFFFFFCRLAHCGRDTDN